MISTLGRVTYIYMDGTAISETDLENQEDYLQRVIRETVDDISSQSIPIVNATVDVQPIIVDKIFETSSDLLILETDQRDLSRIVGLINSHFASIKSLSFYTPYKVELNIPANDKIRLYNVSEDALQKLSKQNIRGVVIGDNERYLLERQSNVATFNRLSQAVRSLFSSQKLEDVDESSKQFETIANFSDAVTAAQLTGDIKQIVQSSGPR